VTRPSVYVETSVISFLVGRRSRSVIVAGHQAVTATFWRDHRHKFDLLVSRIVWDEIGRGDPLLVQRRKKVVNGLRWLQVRGSAAKLAEALIDGGFVPPSASNDALHMAVAAEHGMQFVVTWNFAHIANAAQKKAIGEVCERWGFKMPTICTPEELVFYAE
jgi:hypothetical protein